MDLVEGETMTVSELIDKLNELDGDLEVLTYGTGSCGSEAVDTQPPYTTEAHERYSNHFGTWSQSFCQSYDCKESTYRNRRKVVWI